MGERVAGSPERAVVVVSSSWWAPRSEQAFVLRCVAGALSRHAVVEVVSTTRAAEADTPVTADGVFDVRREPRSDLDPVAGVVLAGDEDARAVLTRAYPSASIVVIGEGNGDGRGAFEWSPALPPLSGAAEIGLSVVVNPLAAERPHNGLGFTGYLLVLTDRGGRERRAADDATDGVRWLAAAFPRRHVVVVEGGVAAVWRGRALRGLVTVDSRIDLWRLMAHAHAVVDLSPGPLVARECVESLRFGTPVIVPARTVASRMAEAGGGGAYGDPNELLRCVDRLDDADARFTAAAEGRTVTDAWYGDPTGFVRRVSDALASVAVPA